MVVEVKSEPNKTGIFKMAASRFVEVTDKEISEIKINSVPKTQKTGINTKIIILPPAR